jgi:hypothetical protein
MIGATLGDFEIGKVDDGSAGDIDDAVATLPEILVNGLALPTRLMSENINNSEVRT